MLITGSVSASPMRDVDSFAVLLRHDAVDGQRKSNPLVFLYSAVIVGIQVGEIRFFIKRVLLDVQTRRESMWAPSMFMPSSRSFVPM